MSDDFTIDFGITTANGKAADDPGIPWAVNIPKVINMVTVSRCDNAGELEVKLQKKDPAVKKINSYCYSCKMGDGYYDICIDNEKVSTRHCVIYKSGDSYYLYDGKWWLKDGKFSLTGEGDPFQDHAATNDTYLKRGSKEEQIEDGVRRKLDNDDIITIAHITSFQIKLK